LLGRTGHPARATSLGDGSRAIAISHTPMSPASGYGAPACTTGASTSPAITGSHASAVLNTCSVSSSATARSPVHAGR
jgi:hypothetical protein